MVTLIDKLELLKEELTKTNYKPGVETIDEAIDEIKKLNNLVDGYRSAQMEDE